MSIGPQKQPSSVHKVEAERKSLYDIDAQRRHIQLRLSLLLDETEGEVTPEVEALEAELLENEFDASQKADAYGWLIKEFESKAAMLKERVEILQQRMRRQQATVDSMKDRLLEFMKAHDLKKIEGDDFVFTRASNGGKLPLELDDVDAESLPDPYRRMEWRVNTDAVREDLEKGDHLPFARLGERGQHLRVR